MVRMYCEKPYASKSENLDEMTNSTSKESSFGRKYPEYLYIY